MLNANEMLLNRKNETKLKQDGEKIVLFTDNLQGFKEEPTIRQAGKIKEKKKKKLHRKCTSFNWLGKKVRNIVKKLNETAKNVVC